MKYAAVAAAVFAGDLFLKNHIEGSRELGDEREACGGRVVITKSHNEGAALNFMEDRPGLVRKVCGASLLALGILWYLLLRKKENAGVMLGLSLLVGGGASNFYDRAARGHVVDYVRFRTPWKKLSRVAFNLSDFCVFLGGVLYVLFRKDA